jgi:TonB family protein
MPLLIPIFQRHSYLPITDIGFEATFNIPAITISGDYSINWFGILGGIYLGISCLLVFRLVYQLVKIALLVNSSKVYKKENLVIVEHTKNIPPFSFMKYCFINPSIIPNDKLEGVIFHERAHYLKNHSADIMLYELIGVLQWYNPFYWMLRRAIVEVHEYQADRTVINTQIDPHAYLDAIVSIAFHGIALPIGNNFNKSLTLKRLAMMNITSNTKRAILRLVIAFVITTPIIVAISCDSSTDPVNSKTKEEKITEPLVIQKVEEDEESEIFMVVEEMPKFQGGDLNTFREWVNKNLKYPEIAQENGIQGRVILSFVVEPDGTIGKITILKGVDPILDNEARRIIGASPKWTPGKQRGQNVRVNYNLPVIFQLK